MIRLTEEQKQKAFSCLLDILICAGVATNSRDDSYGIHYYKTLVSSRGTVSVELKKVSNTIADALCRRTFDFKNVDEAFRTLTDYRVVFGDTPTSKRATWSARSETTLPKFIAYCCAVNKIYWDDTAYTEEERAALRERSIFARMLFEAECFASQPAKGTKKRVSSTGTTATDKVSGGTSGSGAPKSSYKSAGPQSANVAGLVGAPGEKTMIIGRPVYAIIGDKAGSIIPNAFIHPVTNAAVGEKAKVNSAGLPVIKFGAGNGYTDLTIYSTDREQMLDIKARLKATGALDKYGGEASIMGYKANPTGYFTVKTEYGNVLVKPTKLNEKLFEEVFEAMKSEATELLQEGTEEPLSEANKIVDMDAFYADYKRYDC